MSQTGKIVGVNKKGYALRFTTVAGSDKLHDGLKLDLVRANGTVAATKTVQVRTRGPVSNRETPDTRTKELITWAATQ